jgi:hypothetical protein
LCRIVPHVRWGFLTEKKTMLSTKELLVLTCGSRGSTTERECRARELTAESEREGKATVYT